MMKHALCAVQRPLGMMKKNFFGIKKTNPAYLAYRKKGLILHR